MMCEQVVAATHGLEEVVLLETAVFLVHTKERKFHWLLSPGKACPPQFRWRAPLLWEGSDIA